MEPDKKRVLRRIEAYNEHYGNIREFQYKYWNWITGSLERSESALLASFLTVSILGIRQSMIEEYVAPSVIFSIVIFLNLLFPVAANILRSKKTAHFLGLMRQFELPFHEFKDSLTDKSWNEIEQEYRERTRILGDEIDKGNDIGGKINVVYHSLRILSLLMMSIAWVMLLS